MASKKGNKTIFPPFFLFMSDPRWKKIRIRDIHPGSATLLVNPPIHFASYYSWQYDRSTWLTLKRAGCLRGSSTISLIWASCFLHPPMSSYLWKQKIGKTHLKADYVYPSDNLLRFENLILSLSF